MWCFMNIRSAKLDQLAQRLASLTGEDVETALERAIEERLSRVAAPVPTDRKAALDSFFERVSLMRVLDSRPMDEIVGYNIMGCRPDGLGYVRDRRRHRE
jgi:antitoxin VapB